MLSFFFAAHKNSLLLRYHTTITYFSFDRNHEAIKISLWLTPWLRGRMYGMLRQTGASNVKHMWFELVSVMSPDSHRISCIANGWMDELQHANPQVYSFKPLITGISCTRHSLQNDRRSAFLTIWREGTRTPEAVNIIVYPRTKICDYPLKLLPNLYWHCSNNQVQEVHLFTAWFHKETEIEHDGSAKNSKWNNGNFEFTGPINFSPVSVWRRGGKILIPLPSVEDETLGGGYRLEWFSWSTYLHRGPVVSLNSIKLHKLSHTYKYLSPTCLFSFPSRSMKCSLGNQGKGWKNALKKHSWIPGKFYKFFPDSYHILSLSFVEIYALLFV